MVGCYMSWFAMMESDLEKAISHAVGISDSRWMIIGRHLGFIEKAWTFRSLTEYVLQEDLQAKLQNVAKRIEAESTERNNVAHRLFVPSEAEDGVVFYITEAKRKLRLEEQVWTVGDLFERITSLRGMCRDLTAEETTKALSGIPTRFTKIENMRRSAFNALLSSLSAPLQPRPDAD